MGRDGHPEPGVCSGYLDMADGQLFARHQLQRRSARECRQGDRGVQHSREDFGQPLEIVGVWPFLSAPRGPRSSDARIGMTRPATIRRRPAGTRPRRWRAGWRDIDVQWDYGHEAPRTACGIRRSAESSRCSRTPRHDRPSHRGLDDWRWPAPPTTGPHVVRSEEDTFIDAGGARASIPAATKSGKPARSRPRFC